MTRKGSKAMARMSVKGHDSDEVRTSSRRREVSPQFSRRKAFAGGAGAGCQGFPRVGRVENRFEQPWDSRHSRRGALLLGAGAGSPVARRGGRQPCCSASRCEGSAGGGAGWPRREPLSPPDARMNIKQDLG